MPAEARPAPRSHGAAASVDRPTASDGGTDPFVRNLGRGRCGGCRRASCSRRSRINWGAGVPLQRMTQANEDWKDKKGGHFKEGMALKEFSIAARIPRETFHKYAQGKRALGKFIGRPGHLDGDVCCGLGAPPRPGPGRARPR